MKRLDSDQGEPRWLLLFHRIPPEPAYARVKIWRRLQTVGAMTIKNSVYILPINDQTREDFQWIMREVIAANGAASICEARFVDGLTDEQIVGQFRESRDGEYAALEREAIERLNELPRKPSAVETRGELKRLWIRFEEVANIDFFNAGGRAGARSAIQRLEQAMKDPGTRTEERVVAKGEALGRTWVTRRGIKVDRIASAWLIRRFLDPDAHLKFVEEAGYRPAPGEVRFDMFAGEYTHEGDRCSFETLLDRHGLVDPALAALGEIVHDIDLKDRKFSREETPGVARLIVGITASHQSDDERLSRGLALFDDLYASFKEK